MAQTIFMLGSLAPSLVNFRGELLCELLRRGCRVHAAAPAIPTMIRERLEGWGCVVHDVKLERTGLNPLSDLISFSSLRRLLLRVKPDIFIAYTIKPVIFGGLAAASSKVPRRVSLITGLGSAFSSKSNSIVKSSAMALARKLYRIALHRSHVVLFQNNDDKELFLELGLVGATQCGVVNGSGVNTSEFRPVPNTEEPNFLMISRLVIDKGVREYVESARILKQIYPSAKFRLAGWMEQNHPFSIKQTELNEWCQEGTIEFLGRLDDVRPAIADCSVYVLPSYREGTPRTVLEAMAMERPIITTDAPGCRQTVIDNVNGLLVPARSIDDLVRAMRKFVDNPALCQAMGQESRKLVEMKFDVRAVNESIISYLQLS